MFPTFNLMLIFWISGAEFICYTMDFTERPLRGYRIVKVIAIGVTMILPKFPELVSSSFYQFFKPFIHLSAPWPG